MALQLNVIEIVAADLSKSLAFYRRLGLDIPAGAESEPHVEVALAGGIKLAFDTHETIRSFLPDLTPPTGDGISLAFECADPAEVDAVFGDLVDAGHEGHLKPFDAPWGQRYASVTDPDGNGVDLYAAL